MASQAERGVDLALRATLSHPRNDLQSGQLSHTTMDRRTQMDPWHFWKDSINMPKFILAPMVDHSELPWRMLSREYGCQAAYTPMFHASNFATSKKYRQKSFTTCSDDRPLFVQFCANNPDSLLEAARFVANDCDGIDINLGCPQEIARRGRYGAFLQDEWKLIEEMVTKLRSDLKPSLAVSCKIRRFESKEKTVQYARMLERAGCTFIGVHGRTREQRGCKTGLADWAYIKAAKESVNIPVIANGNIQSLGDAEACFKATNADAIMTAEGNLYNPALFQNVHPPAWEVANKYLDYVKQYPIPAGQSTTLEDLYEVVDCFKRRYRPDDELMRNDLYMPITVQPVPPYLCQPRFRYDVNKPTTGSELGRPHEGVDEDDDAAKKRIKLNGSVQGGSVQDE